MSVTSSFRLNSGICIAIFCPAPQVFDKYVKERADEERKEKKAKAKEIKDNFKTLCEEARVSSKSSFSEFTK
jgi:hypothetical protein